MRRFDPKDASFTPEINFFFLPLNPTNRLYMRSTAAEDSSPGLLSILHFELPNTSEDEFGSLA